MGGPRGGEVTPLAPFIIFLGECDRPVELNLSFGLGKLGLGVHVWVLQSIVCVAVVVFVRLLQIKNEADDDGVMFFSSRDASLSLA